MYLKNSDSQNPEPKTQNGFGGVIFISNISEDNMIYDYVKTDVAGFLLHRQIEKRDGLVFMRFKKRPVIVVSTKNKQNN